MSMNKPNKREQRFRRKSMWDLLSDEEREELCLNGRSLQIVLFFKRTESDESLPYFQELPYMTWSSMEILDNLVTEESLQDLSMGETIIHIGMDGATSVFIDGKLRNDDPFSVRLLKDHLFVGFNLAMRVKRLEEELQAVRSIPMEQTIVLCEKIIRDYFVLAQQECVNVMTADDIHFVLTDPEDDGELNPSMPERPFVVVPLPPEMTESQNMFFSTIVALFLNGYRRVIEHCFERVAREIRKDPKKNIVYVMPLQGDAESYS